MNEELDPPPAGELRRGTIVLACLRLLREPGYGYGLLEQLTRHGFETDANTLYPLLRRLEKQGHLVSEWSTTQARPRKFYRTSDEGERLADALTIDWAALTTSIASLDDSAESAATPTPPTTRPPGAARRLTRSTDMSATLTDRYIAATLRGVPAEAHDDVRNELTGSIADAVEARIEQGESPDEAERAALNELGDPAVLAAGTRRPAASADRPAPLPDVAAPAEGCSSPSSAASVAVLVALGYAISGADVGDIVAEGIVSGITAGLHVCVWTTLAFAVMDRLGAAGSLGGRRSTGCRRIGPRGEDWPT